MNKINTGLLLTLTLWLLAGCAPSISPTAQHATRQAQRLAYINRLNELIGQAEFVWPAGGEAGDAMLSPDGRWMLSISTQGPVLVDLATGAQQVFEAPFGKWIWVTEEYFVISSHLFHVPDLQVTKLETHRGTEYLELFQGAESVYVLVSSDSVVISTDPDYPYKVDPARSKDIEVLGDTPYTIVLDQMRRSLPWQKTALLSPDGRYYAINRSFCDVPHGNMNMGVTIFDAATDEVVAMAFKDSWVMPLLGWAFDSSGVYLKYYVANPDGNILYPESVVIKLLTPETPLRGTPVPVVTPNATPQCTPVFWPTPIMPTATP